MNSALNELNTLPLSNRLIKNTHRILLSKGRGEHKTPGEFRVSQNWLGGATLTDAVFVPPSHEHLPELLSDLEMFLNNNTIKIPHLVRIAIAHYQFETIHPFLDGNGRIGRLLITLYLVYSKVLQQPLLYLSDFFEKHKALYYDNLTLVRTKNDITQWIKFFLTGVSETAQNAANTLKHIIDLRRDYEKTILNNFGKRTAIGVDLLNLLFSKPIVSSTTVQEALNLSAKTANSLLRAFTEAAILKESTGYRRNRTFIFDEYIRLF